MIDKNSEVLTKISDLLDYVNNTSFPSVSIKTTQIKEKEKEKKTPLPKKDLKESKTISLDQKRLIVKGIFNNTKIEKEEEKSILRINEILDNMHIIDKTLESLKDSDLNASPEYIRANSLWDSFNADEKEHLYLFCVRSDGNLEKGEKKEQKPIQSTMKFAQLHQEDQFLITKYLGQWLNEYIEKTTKKPLTPLSKEDLKHFSLVFHLLWIKLDENEQLKYKNLAQEIKPLLDSDMVNFLRSKIDTLRFWGHDWEETLEKNDIVIAVVNGSWYLAKIIPVSRNRLSNEKSFRVHPILDDIPSNFPDDSYWTIPKNIPLFVKGWDGKNMLVALTPQELSQIKASKIKGVRAIIKERKQATGKVAFSPMDLMKYAEDNYKIHIKDILKEY